MKKYTAHHKNIVRLFLLAIFFITYPLSAYPSGSKLAASLQMAETNLSNPALRQDYAQELYLASAESEGAGDHKKAEELLAASENEFLAAARLFKKAGNKASEADAYAKIGNIYMYARKDFKLSEYYFLKAVHLFRGNQSGVQGMNVWVNAAYAAHYKAEIPSQNAIWKEDLAERWEEFCEWLDGLAAWRIPKLSRVSGLVESEAVPQKTAAAPKPEAPVKQESAPSSDQILLRSGQTISGHITKREAAGMWVDMGMGASVYFSNNEIQQINGGSTKAAVPPDLTKHFTIMSPKYTKKISYGFTSPLFHITAPTDWYMAKKLENEPGYERAFFSKEDPTKALSQGIYDFDFAYIGVTIRPNQKNLSASQMIDAIMGDTSFAKTHSIMEKIQIGKNLAGHFMAPNSTRAGFTEDSYLFVNGPLIVQVVGMGKPAELDVLKSATREAANSVSFESII